MASSTEAGADAEGGVTADADAAGRACAALLHATPPARQFAPLYLCRILVRSEAFATAFLDGEAFQGGRGYMTLPLTLTPTLTLTLTLTLALALTWPTREPWPGSPAAAKSARVLGLTSLANLAGAPHGVKLLLAEERGPLWLQLHARAVELVLHP